MRRAKDFDIAYPEDLYQEYCLMVLEGYSNRQTLGLFCIDFMRKEVGKASLCGNRPKHLFYYALPFDVKLHSPVVNPSEAMGQAMDIENAMALLTPSEKEAFLCAEVLEDFLYQIADRDGVTHAAVYHRLIRANKKFKRWREEE